MVNVVKDIFAVFYAILFPYSKDYLTRINTGKL